MLPRSPETYPRSYGIVAQAGVAVLPRPGPAPSAMCVDRESGPSPSAHSSGSLGKDHCLHQRHHSHDGTFFFGFTDEQERSQSHTTETDCNREEKQLNWHSWPLNCSRRSQASHGVIDGDCENQHVCSKGVAGRGEVALDRPGLDESCSRCVTLF